MAEKGYEYFKRKYNETSIHDEKSDFYFFATILGELAVTKFWENWRAFLDLTEFCEQSDIPSDDDVIIADNMTKSGAEITNKEGS